MLLFGPDRGLVRERSQQLATAVLGDTSDPFRLIEMTAAGLRAQPSALADAARSFPLLPGRQVIRIRDAADSLVEALRLLVETGQWEALVLLEAGDLGKRSSLRLLFEGGPALAAIACHGDDGTMLHQVIEETLGRFAVVASAEATELLSALLGADRALTRQELSKLATYCGDSQRASVDDVLAVVGDTASTTLTDLALIAAAGDRLRLNRALIALDRGLEPIGLLRATQLHLQRLHRAQAEMARGRSAREAVQALRPPVFFRMLDEFSRQLRLWRADALELALLGLVQAEAACKRTGAPQLLLAAAALFEVARLARPPAGLRADR